MAILEAKAGCFEKIKLETLVAFPLRQGFQKWRFGGKVAILKALKPQEFFGD